MVVIGREVDEAKKISHVVGLALGLGLVPGFCLCLLAGAWLSMRAQERVEEVKIYPTNMPLVRSETADLDVAAAAGFLRSSAAVTRVVSIGFCFAGAISWRQATRGLDAAVGFYGCAEDFRASVPDLKTLTAPMLLFVAGKDTVYPPEDLLRLDIELEEAGVRHTTVVFENAPHGFFKLSDQWQEECERAWSELLAFLEGVAGFAG